MDAQEEVKVSGIVTRAAGREPNEVKIIFAGLGSGIFSDWLIIKLDKSVVLGDVAFDPQVFVSFLLTGMKTSAEQ